MLKARSIGLEATRAADEWRRIRKVQNAIRPL